MENTVSNFLKTFRRDIEAMTTDREVLNAKEYGFFTRNVIG